MSDPSIIPDENIITPENSEGSIRPFGEDGPLTIPSEVDEPKVTIELTSEDYPEAPSLGSVRPVDTENIDTYEVYYKTPGSDTWESLDKDNDGEPDVRFLAMI